jgi:hypothetical protein
MSVVSLLKTSPETVTSDYDQVMQLANFKHAISKDHPTILKLNLSWTLYYPACSTPPWQLEGVLNTLRGENYQDVTAVENQTVVTHPGKEPILINGCPYSGNMRWNSNHSPMWNGLPTNLKVICWL